MCENLAWAYSGAGVRSLTSSDRPPVVNKRGRGRPKGSKNKKKPPSSKFSEWFQSVSDDTKRKDRTSLLPTPEEFAKDPIGAARSIETGLRDRNLLVLFAGIGVVLAILSPILSIAFGGFIALTTVLVIPIAVVGTVLSFLHIPAWVALTGVLAAVVPPVLVFTGLSRVVSSYLNPQQEQTEKEAEEVEEPELTPEEEEELAARKATEETQRYADESLSSFDQRLQNSSSNQRAVVLWTSSTVAQQLALEGLEAYAPRFQAQNIDGQALLSLDDSDFLLPELAGPSPPTLGDRKKFARFLRRVQAESGTSN